MTTTKTPMLVRLTRWGAVAAIACAVLVWPVRALLAAQASDVLVIAPHKDAVIVKTNEALFDPEGLSPAEVRNEVIRIYGSPLGQEQLLFVDESTFIRPKLVEGLTLYPKADDANPLKMDTIDWAAPKVSIGAAIVAMLLFGLSLLLARRARSS